MIPESFVFLFQNFLETCPLTVKGKPHMFTKGTITYPPPVPLHFLGIRDTVVSFIRYNRRMESLSSLLL